MSRGIIVVIKIEALSKVYPSRKGAPPVYALNNISLDVKKGDIYGIIGMSGAGKTTLIRCLTALEPPTEGGVWIEDVELSTLSRKELRCARKKIGMIFQHFNLFSSRTALENVLFPMEIVNRENLDRAEELLELVGLKHKKHAYPAQLSGGEKQRVGIARALACSPAVLLCDEATSSLDPKTTQTILDLLVELNSSLGLTIILITHQMEVIKKICTRVAVLEHGEIIEEGSVEDLFAAPSHPTTKQFLQGLVHELPDHFLPKQEGKELIRLSFKGEGAGQPIISRLIKNYEVEVNILLGGIDSLRTTTIGNLVVELSGSQEELRKARSFLESQDVICEVIR